MPPPGACMRFYGYYQYTSYLDCMGFSRYQRKRCVLLLSALRQPNLAMFSFLCCLQGVCLCPLQSTTMLPSLAASYLQLLTVYSNRRHLLCRRAAAAARPQAPRPRRGMRRAPRSGAAGCASWGPARGQRAAAREPCTALQQNVSFCPAVAVPPSCPVVFRCSMRPSAAAQAVRGIARMQYAGAEHAAHARTVGKWYNRAPQQDGGLSAGHY